MSKQFIDEQNMFIVLQQMNRFFTFLFDCTLFSLLYKTDPLVLMKTLPCDAGKTFSSATSAQSAFTNMFTTEHLLMLELTPASS